jgi:hypothetical protein
VVLEWVKAKLAELRDILPAGVSIRPYVLWGKRRLRIARRFSHSASGSPT